MSAVEIFGYLTDTTFATVVCAVVGVAASLVFIDGLGGKRK